MGAKAKWMKWHTASLLISLALIVIVGLSFDESHRMWAWLINMLLLALFSTIAGHGITGLWRGLLIDDRNKMSLSRLQMTLWTIVVLSGLLTAALSNIAGGFAKPLEIQIGTELWLLMGISTTSLIGSPLLKAGKRTKTTREEELRPTLELLKEQGVAPEHVSHVGKIVTNKTIEDARWSDMFKGEETANAAHLDLAKIQMFYFTIILVIVYGVALGTVFSESIARIDALPVLDEGMISLLGISHAGYLVNKAVPHSEGASQA